MGGMVISTTDRQLSLEPTRSGLGLLRQRLFELLAVLPQRTLKGIHALQFGVSLSDQLLCLFAQRCGFCLDIVVLRNTRLRLGEVLIGLSRFRQKLSLGRNKVRSGEEVVHAAFDQLNTQGQGIGPRLNCSHLRFHFALEAFVFCAKRTFKACKQLGVKTAPARFGGSLHTSFQVIGHSKRVAGSLVSVCSHRPIVDVSENLFKESY